MEYSASLPSPLLFRKWTAITTLAGALERRVWTTTSYGGALYPNLFVLLVSPPGIGKSIILKDALALWRGTKILKVAPDSVTKAALVDCVARASRIVKLSPEKIIDFHSLQICATEFAVLVPATDHIFLNTLNKLYDCEPVFSEERRSRKEEDQIAIPNPQINLLGGSQPAYLAYMLPDNAWRMGFTSRTILVYQGESVRAPVFGGSEPSMDLFGKLLSDLTKVTNLYGKFRWDPGAQAVANDWHMGGQQPVPTHNKLEAYKTRRLTNLLKLAMVFSVSRSSVLLVEKRDVEMALSAMIEIEAVMPDIFLDMTGTGDGAAAQDCYSEIWRQFATTGQPVPEHIIAAFLGRRVASYAVPKVIENMIRSAMIEQVHTGDGRKFYKPLPMH